MKIKYIFFLILGWSLSSCEYDNYDAPKSTLTGKVVYQGEPINVASNEVHLELWEPGWQLRNRIDVTMDQDGSYSASLFDAEYKVVFRQGQGPFRMITNPVTNSDTILVNVKGATVQDIEVMPYYMIRSPQISKSGSNVNATASIEQIIKDGNARDIERVSLFINRTTFVDNRGNYHLAVQHLQANEIADLSNVSLSLAIPDLVRAQNYIYARIGVKIQGVEQLIYSPVQQLEL
ncbi:MAG TPA: DUF3823 domain-containing protein [Cyclobacteriaceae bacterium]|nr:DUF3823 domain-containing protein [Cyclobacteriaceae bacterium]